MKETTPELFAAKLNGREYGSEITKEEEAQAREAGLVVVFGYSDDNMEFRGAIHDEVSCYNGGSAYVHPKKGLILHPEDCECPYCAFDELIEASTEVKAVWNDRGPWTYETNIPHATFEIHEDEDIYCQGIVFRLEDL